MTSDRLWILSLDTCPFTDMLIAEHVMGWFVSIHPGAQYPSKLADPNWNDYLIRAKSYTPMGPSQDIMASTWSGDSHGWRPSLRLDDAQSVVQAAFKDCVVALLWADGDATVTITPCDGSPKVLAQATDKSGALALCKAMLIATSFEWRGTDPEAPLPRRPNVKLIEQRTGWYHVDARQADDRSGDMNRWEVRGIPPHRKQHLGNYGLVSDDGLPAGTEAMPEEVWRAALAH